MEGAAIAFYANSDSYTQDKIWGFTSVFTGGIMKGANGVKGYFGLRSENEELLTRSATLEEMLEYQQTRLSDSLLLANSFEDDLGVEYYAAHVVSNSINKQQNYIMIDRGFDDGIREGMAVVSPQREIIGRVVRSSSRYSIVMSVLNVDFRTSGLLVNGEYAGSIYWEGRDRYRVKMDELSKYANVYNGVEVVTAGYSHIFPQGIMIGRVVSYELNDAQTAYSLDIELAVDLSKVGKVLVINNRRSAEGRQLLDDFEQTGVITH